MWTVLTLDKDIIHSFISLRIKVDLKPIPGTQPGLDFCLTLGLKVSALQVVKKFPSLVRKTNIIL